MEIKEEMREIIENGVELEKITLPLSDYKKYLIEEHELFFHDKLYDVSRVEIEGDSIIFYCIHDEKEQQLLASLEIIFGLEEENANNNNSDLELLNFLNISSIINQQNSLIKNSVYLASIKDFTPVLQSQSITPNTQPPKHILSA